MAESRNPSFFDKAAQVASEATRIVTNPAEASGIKRLAAFSLSRVADVAVRGASDAATVLTGADANDRLHERGDALIYRSWDAADQARRQHPAFDHIIDELTPDEARILRFLTVAGAQPAIDIRTNTLFGVGSKRIAAGISFIADMAGCAWPDRSRHYLGNLNRLGLVRFSKEPVDDFRRYYLLDAHPDAVAAYKHPSRTIAVYRSIYLSVFGEEFCSASFTTAGYDGGGWAHVDRGDVYWGKGPRLD